MKVIQVGTGKMGQRWLEVLTESDEVTLVGVVEPVDALRERSLVKTGLPAEAAFASLDDALTASDFEAAVIVTPPPSHRLLAEQLLNAGKHVITEKPLATTLDDARQMIATAERNQRTLMVAQNYRYFAAFATVRGLIAGGEIGKVTAVNIAFHKDARNMFGEGDFRYSMPNVLLLDMSIHHFDMIRAALGTDAARVYAQTWHVPDGNFEFDAAASVVITMNDGAVVTYTGNWATYSPETSWNGAWEIIGEGGRISWTGGDWNEAQVTIQRFGEAATAVPIADLERAGQFGLVADFVAAISNGSQPDTAAASNVHSLAIVFAAVESAETGNVVHLD